MKYLLTKESGRGEQSMGIYIKSNIPTKNYSRHFVLHDRLWCIESRYDVAGCFLMIGKIDPVTEKLLRHFSLCLIALEILISPL